VLFQVHLARMELQEQLEPMVQRDRQDQQVDIKVG
jgi:hypothetical protein